MPRQHEGAQETRGFYHIELNRQKRSQLLYGRLQGIRRPIEHLELGLCQVGRCSFFKNAAYRGSLGKVLSRGSTFVALRPPSRWAKTRFSHSNAWSDWFRNA